MQEMEKNAMARSETGSIELDTYNKLKNDILSQRLAFGTKLNESELSHMYGVSRTPIRSALKKLSYEGLVVLETNKGASVVKPSVKELSQILETRMVLERAAMNMAVQNISDEELQHLSSLLKEETQCYVSRNLERYIRVNHNIHMIIANATRNKYFIEFIDKLMTKSSIYLLFFDSFYTVPLSKVLSIKEHQQVFKALKARDAAACDLWERHIASSFQSIIQKFSFQPVVFNILPRENDNPK